jgi:tetratricopeptide (TPR) repeat protein
MIMSILCHPMGLTFPLAAWALHRSRAATKMVIVAVMAAVVLLLGRAPFKMSLDWLYLLWAALVAATVLGIARVMPQRGWRVSGAVAGVVMTGLTVATVLRAAPFRSDDAYWRAALRWNPASADALAHLGQFDRALRIDPHHRGALLGLAAAHGAGREWDRAVARYQQVLALDPRDADALFGLAVAYAQQDRTDDAIRAMLDVLRIHPDDARAHRELSVLYREKGDTSRALQHGERAMRLEPRRPEPYLELATLTLTRLGDVKRAQWLLERARRLDPLRSDTLRVAGQVQFDIAKLQTDAARRAEGFDNAILLFRAAANLAPNSGPAHRELGIALATAAAQPSRPFRQRFDQLGDAIFHFDRAAALAPSLGDLSELRNLAQRDRAALEQQMR